MKRILAAFALLLAGFASAAGQGVTAFPQTLPANTLVGRLGISPGPSQAIPFSILLPRLLAGVDCADGAILVWPGPICSTAMSTVPFSISPASADYFSGGLGVSPSLGKIYGGSNSVPLTTASPLVGITRVESITSGTTTDGKNPALYVASVGTSTSTRQSNALTAQAFHNNVGDSVAGLFYSEHRGTEISPGVASYAYGIFAAATATTDSTGAIAVQTNTENSTGEDRPYVPLSANSWFIGGDFNYNSSTGNYGGIGVYIRTSSGTVSGGNWDIGLLISAGYTAKTASMRDDSTSPIVFDARGTHTTGFTTLNGTYSGNQFEGTGFSVSAAGAIVSASTIRAAAASGFYLGANNFAVVGGNYTIMKSADATSTVELGTTTNGVIAKGSYLELRNEAGTANFARISSAGHTIYGSSSGSVTLAVPAAAGSNTITFPAGTTNFTATGGTSQVVKQTSAGGAFTVARLACADLSDAGAGCSGTSGITQLTGDVTAGPGTGSVAATLATVNSNVGTFGSATQVAQITVNGKGLTTAVTSVTVTPAVGSITGLGTGVATALAVNVGSAGAFVTFNGALGTPSSGTVTNLTGTASININGTVGASTPTTGAFTNVAASTSVTSPLHIGGSGTTGTQLTFKTTTGNGTTDAFAWVGGNNGASAFGVLQLNTVSAPSTQSGKLYVASLNVGTGATNDGFGITFGGIRQIKNSDNYFGFFDASGTDAVFEAGASSIDPTVYFSQTTHKFRTQGGGTTVLTISNGAAVFNGYVQTVVTTVGSLGTCDSGTKGARKFVSDATATTFASTAAGGGANNVPVVCNGTNWIIGANDNIPADQMRKYA